MKAPNVRSLSCLLFVRLFCLMLKSTIYDTSFYFPAHTHVRARTYVHFKIEPTGPFIRNSSTVNPSLNLLHFTQYFCKHASNKEYLSTRSSFQNSTLTRKTQPPNRSSDFVLFLPSLLIDYSTTPLPVLGVSPCEYIVVPSDVNETSSHPR